MKNVRRREVVKFLTEQGFVVKSDDGIHTKWVKSGFQIIPLPRHAGISPGVLRMIEKVIGFVPEEWK